MNATMTEPAKLTRQDFVSNQDVRWCPGCGDYSILAQMQRMLPEIGIAREQLVFVSGIGCSSRFPYYMDTYGFHTIHGRGPAIATGIKCARPDLSVWVATGDGDGLSIGGNHMLHTLRRNVDIKILLFNNRIYGLTKGQTSPTSERGKKTKSTPMGSIENPIHPISFAVASEATFVARTLDADPQHLKETLKRAALHKGTAFVEVLQNCNIFNDHAWESVADKQQRFDNAIYLEHDKPLIYGKDGTKGIRRSGCGLEPVTIGENGVTESDLAVHDEHSSGTMWAYQLSRIERFDMPVPMGVFRAVQEPTYDELLEEQVREAKEHGSHALLQKLLYTGQRWTVNGSDGGNGSGPASN